MAEETKKLTEDQRKNIFLALVTAQDQDVGVSQSRRMIAERFGLADQDIREIEREGLDQQWPPLDA